MIRMLVMVSVLGLAASANVRAQSEPLNATLGAGNESCGKFLDYERRSDQVSVFMIVSWVQGFISAENISIATGTNQPFLHLPDGETVRAYLDKFCRENPLDSPALGAGKLYHELQARQQATAPQSSRH